MKYIIDSRYFNGSCITLIPDDVQGLSCGRTLEELRLTYDNPYLEAVSPQRMKILMRRYEAALQEPFREITAERYYTLRDCVPPLRLQRHRIFMGEAYTGSLHALCFCAGGRYFTGLRPIESSDADIERMIALFARKRTFHPAIVKDTPVVIANRWRDATYIPYYFERNDRRYFIHNLCIGTGNSVEERRARHNMAEYLLNLRRNHYDYGTFHSVKKDIFEFFAWLRKHEYTLEVHRTLFDFADDHTYADFHGNVCEYAAAFHYRIYSRELFKNIINQLRRVQRYDIWRKKTTDQ